MSQFSPSSWREPRRPDWQEQIRELTTECRAGAIGGGFADRLRRLAGMRLNDSDFLRMGRLIRLMRKEKRQPAAFRALRALVVSNRTANWFVEHLEVAGLARGLLVEGVDPGFDSVAALAFDPKSALPSGHYDIVLVLLDSAFFLTDLPKLDEDAEADYRARVENDISKIASALSEKAQAPVLFANICLPPDLEQSYADIGLPGTPRRQAGYVNAAIAELARRGELLPFDLEMMAQRIGLYGMIDPVKLHEAKMLFSSDASPLIADSLAASIAAIFGKSGRVLVLDLDNTVWGGVVAEEGLEGIRIGQGNAEGEAFLSLQRYAKALKSRGIALAVCSKNLEAAAKSPFQKHPDMVLREEDFVVFAANFEDKATNLAKIASSLNLDASSLVFVDDNPAERERVRAGLPFVMVPELPEDPGNYVRAIVASGYLEHSPLTREDARRAQAYQARELAKSALDDVGDYDAYLRSLEMELFIAPFDSIGRSRIAQLIQKSNQFNLTTRRYTAQDIARFEAAPDMLCWQVRLRDRFADHGMISVVIARKAAAAWEIDTWLMSCRVLERRVEHEIMRRLATLAEKDGVERLIGRYIPTAKNKLVEEFYSRMGFTEEHRHPTDGVAYRLDLPDRALAEVETFFTVSVSG